MLSMLLRLLFVAVGVVTAARTKGALRVYAVLAAFSVAALELAYQAYGFSSIYTIVYVAVRVPELIAMFWLSRIRLAAIPGAFGITFMALLAFRPSSAGAICLLEGGLFALAGISAGLRAKDRITGTLAILWLLLAVYDFGYALGWQAPAWRELNQWWPTALCIGAFGYIGYEVRALQERNSSA
jgi:hypothetical protein